MLVSTHAHLGMGNYPQALDLGLTQLELANNLIQPSPRRTRFVTAPSPRLKKPGWCKIKSPTRAFALRHIPRSERSVADHSAFADLLDQDLTDNDRARVSGDLNWIRSAAATMQKRVTELVRLAQIRRQPPGFAPVDMNETVHEVVNSLGGPISERGSL